MEKQLGKISYVRIGAGGYDDAMFGVSLGMTGDGWGVNDFVGTWNRDPDEHTKWTAEQRDAEYLKAFCRLREWMNQAKVKDAYKLVGIPIEATFLDFKLVSWRILTEVL